MTVICFSFLPPPESLCINQTAGSFVHHLADVFCRVDKQWTNQHIPLRHMICYSSYSGCTYGGAVVLHPEVTVGKCDLAHQDKAMAGSRNSVTG